eukprot:1620100-Pleurochrysis_carterae.AAC.1
MAVARMDAMQLSSHALAPPWPPVSLCSRALPVHAALLSSLKVPNSSPQSGEYRRDFLVLAKSPRRAHCT